MKPVRHTLLLTALAQVLAQVLALMLVVSVAGAETPVSEPQLKQHAPIQTSPAPKYRQLSLQASVAFEPGASQLSAAGRAIIDDLLNQVGTASIQNLSLVGHSDNRGSSELNQRLSAQRAAAVKAELIARGIDPELIFSNAYGESRPRADNTDPAGRAQNRRVEIRIEAQQRYF